MTSDKVITNIKRVKFFLRHSVVIAIIFLVIVVVIIIISSSIISSIINLFVEQKLHLDLHMTVRSSPRHA